MSKYKAVIGIEMHCEIKTNSKMFSSAKNEYSELANSNISAVDMAFPGFLPVVNKEGIRKGLLMSMILNCEQPEYIIFDRKNYYYPDLPKGYQITQMHYPVGVNGSIIIDCGSYEKEIKIHDIHMEEDTAIMEHFSDASLLDYNRAGIPLWEIVTEPCMNSADEAVAFINEMIRIYRYTGISDADTRLGQVRCDVNVSIMDEDSTTLGTKVEVKGVNSITNVYDTINYEIKRQSELKEAGRYNEVIQETRRFDEESGTTIRMRNKIDDVDYKYFIEPNIPKYKVSQEWLQEIRKSIPMLPKERKELYINTYHLSDYDANIIIKERDYAEYFEECVHLGMDAKTAANWLIVNIIGYLAKDDIKLSEFYLKPEYLKQIIDAQVKGTISSKQAKEIFNKAIECKKEPKNFINEDNAQISDEAELTAIIENILASNEKQIEEYHNGKTNLFDYFVGQVMKETKGKANPVLTKEILRSKLG